MNNSCNNNNNDNEYNIKLYNSVFNNIYLKSIIFHHLNIFNILLPVNIEFESIEEWQQFKYKDYLNTVTYYKELDLNQLSDNIRHIVIRSPSKDSTNIIQIINSIPNHIDSFRFMERLLPYQLDMIYPRSSSTINSTSLSKLKSLEFDCYFSFEPDSITIPPSITKLDIFGTPKFKLKKSLLPSGLKELKYYLINSFEDGCLPESLTHVTFKQLDDLLLINQLSLNGLVKLELDYKKNIGSDIRFPNTLQHLDISSCNSFNATLPNGLKSFNIHMRRYKYEIQFPSSLEQLYISFSSNILKKEVFQSRNSVPVNLKSLDIQCSSIIDSDGHSILPDTLESLTLDDFNQVIKENQLPSSLTYLKLGSSFQHTIDINVLPSSLKILKLYRYSQAINPLSIPSTLQILRIINTEYTHPIRLTPTSHPNTAIDCDDLNLYYDPSNTDIRVLKLPYLFSSPLSTLQLQDKCNLNYLHLGYTFNHPIQLSDLPINNQIKILELSFRFSHTINLEYFQNLESIIINDSNLLTGKLLNITTTINDDNGIYNYYKLKEIQIPNLNSRFIKQLDINFYRFIKLNKSK